MARAFAYLFRLFLSLWTLTACGLLSGFDSLHAQDNLKGKCRSIPPLLVRMKVAYSDRMLAPSEHKVSDSSIKPGLFVDALQKTRRPIEIIEPAQFSPEDFYRAHSPDYVDAILAGKQNNGFGNRSLLIAKSLPYTTGSLYSASLAALEDGIACSPTSGFHHAMYGKASGFCTFNGLIAAPLRLMEEKKIKTVAIIDADFHIGDGTQQIIDRLKLRPRFFHYSLGAKFPEYYPFVGEDYLEDMNKLKLTLGLANPDLIIYQAGADPHVKDPMHIGSRGILDTNEMRLRDRIMFETSFELGIPIVWNLAGGYQRDAQGTISPVIGLHLTTFDEAVKAYR